MKKPWYADLDAYRTDADDPSKTSPVMLTFGSRLIPLSELRRIVRENVG